MSALQSALKTAESTVNTTNKIQKLIQKARDMCLDVPEINIQNYTEEEIDEVNSKIDELLQFLEGAVNGTDITNTPG